MVAIALLQMLACGTDQEANRAKGDAYCRQARELGADIALFPEMWNVGYTGFDPGTPGAHERWEAGAVERDGAFVRHFRELAVELDMAIALTYLERWEGGPRNTVSLIDRRGDILLSYAKVHTCDFEFEAACTPGEAFYVCRLETAAGAVDIGAMICFDREFPESARLLMLQGAELILVPNACTMENLRLHQLEARAYENMVGIALTNYAAPQQNGHSVAFDAVAYDEPDGEANDIRLIEAGGEEGLYLAEFDLARLRAYRERESWGDAYRKPGLYGRLTVPDVHPPFVRGDARRR